MTQVKKTVKCLKKSKGKCVKNKTESKKLFWITQPTCPASGQLRFESDFVYETGLKGNDGNRRRLPAFPDLMNATRRLLRTVSLTAAALLALPALAAADPVQEVNVQLQNIKPDGRYSVVFSANSYDTTGAPPPLVTKNTVRLAVGHLDQAAVPDQAVPVQGRGRARRDAGRPSPARSRSGSRTSPRRSSARAAS